MAFQRGWALGLLPLVVLWIVATNSVVDQVESDLKSRALGAIGNDRLDKAAVEVAGRDVRLAGAGFTPESKNSAAAVVDAAFGVRRVDDTLVTLIPESKPYLWSARREGAKITLGGSVPDPAARGLINAAAQKAMGAAAVDTMIYGRGDAGALVAAAAFALGELGHMSQGAADLRDKSLTITGEAADSAQYEAAMAALKAPPQGATLSKVEIAPPLAKPYVLSATNSGKGFVVTGDVPSLASRGALVAAGAAPDSKLTFARGAPADFDALAKFAIDAVANLDGGKAVLTDTTLDISGKARKPGDWEALQAHIAAAPKGLVLGKVEVAPPVASPYFLSANVDAGAIELTGYAPSARQVGLIGDAARVIATDRSLVNKLLVAQGAPGGDYLDAARFVIGAVAGFETGKATLSDGRLSLSGQARRSGGAEALAAMLATLPAGLSLGDVAVVPAPARPYIFVVTKTEAGLKLSGSVPDVAARKALEAEAVGATDETKLASGQPAGVDLVAVGRFALAELAGLKSGEARLEDAAFSIKGVAPDAASGAAAEAKLSSLPRGVALTSASIEKPAAPPAALASLDEIASAAKAEAEGKPDLDVPNCDASFKSELATENILFESGKATISRESYRLIVKLAGVAIRCQVQQIEVAGYTDSQGDDALNEKLSQARAQTVADALGKAGVSADRLAATGYGAKNPIASNDTEDGRAKNRRIEFTVK